MQNTFNFLAWLNYKKINCFLKKPRRLIRMDYDDDWEDDDDDEEEDEW